MDLRSEKTLEIIKDQFLFFRKTMPLNKIKVNAICENGKINKTTFYRHYVDIFDLSDKIENQAVSELIADWENFDCLFSNPELFIEGLFRAINKHQEIINILFLDQIEVFESKIEAALLCHYQKHPVSAESSIKLSFIIGGAAHVFLNCKSDHSKVSKVLVELLKILSV